MNKNKSELEEIQLLKQENKALKSTNRKSSKKGIRLVAGFYEKGSKSYQFKAGIHKFWLPNLIQMVGGKKEASELVDPIGRVESKKALSNTIIMDHLIKIGFDGIEVVED